MPGGLVARAVDGVSLDLYPGETLALVGESGSGKTTLALSLLRLIPEPPGRIDPAGRVELDGADILRWDAKALRRVRGGDLAMIFQEPGSSLNPVMTVGSQITETVRAHGQPDRRAARRRALELLADVGISDPDRRLGQYPHQLSGGMQQRVMIAMALAGNPKVLIADEPTTALDVTIQLQILDLLSDLQRRLGLAVLLITHDLGLAARVADRVAVMYAGRIAESAPAARLFDHPQHPYTEALLHAVPRIDRDVARLPVVPGQPPLATQWPTGCRFHPRCRHAWERCRGAEPSLLGTDQEHLARCWLVDEPARRAP
ncbi:MAG: ABC transporter ATP-binding protein [Gemmatimonadetes bacterium]|nr:ABC transporter ATP-binding protein [Gemmatimonadota bacterium]